MELFVGRLPHRVSKQELHRFLSLGIRNKTLLGFLRKPEPTWTIRMMVMRSKRHGKPAYFAVVSHMPYKDAQRVIKNLNRTRFGSVEVSVRQYAARSWRNDPRQNAGDAGRTIGSDRRRHDRRDFWIVTELDDGPVISIEGLKQFAREHL